MACRFEGRVRAHARSRLPSASQSSKCVYPVGVTDRGLPSCVMCELTLRHLGGTNSPVAFPAVMLAAHTLRFVFERYFLLARFVVESHIPVGPVSRS